MLGEIAVTGVDIRLVAMRLGHATAQIVGHQDLCGAAEKSKTAGVRAQPVGQFLRPGGFGEGVAGGAQHGDEDLCLANFAGLPVDDWHRLAGIVDEQLFTCTMFLAHDHVDLGGPEPVVLAEPAVLEALRMGESIFLPKQGQGYAGAAQLCVDMSPVRHRTLIAGDVGWWRKKTLLQLRLARRTRPSQPAGSKAIEVLTDSCATHLQADSDLASR